MKNNKHECRFTVLANKLDLLCAIKGRTALIKTLFNPPLLLLVLIFIVRLGE